jgi:hypothetical protein
MKAGINPQEEVARELRIECSPLDLITTFTNELLIAGWTLETAATMVGEYASAMVFESAALVIGELISEVFAEMKKEGIDTNSIERAAFDLFKESLGDSMKSERPITAGETLAMRALLGAPPLPAA